MRQDHENDINKVNAEPNYSSGITSDETGNDLDEESQISADGNNSQTFI